MYACMRGIAFRFACFQLTSLLEGGSMLANSSSTSGSEACKKKNSYAASPHKKYFGMQIVLLLPKEQANQSPPDVNGR